MIYANLAGGQQECQNDSKQQKIAIHKKKGYMWEKVT